jgi:hypothetical protein
MAQHRLPLRLDASWKVTTSDDKSRLRSRGLRTQPGIGYFHPTPAEQQAGEEIQTSEHADHKGNSAEKKGSAETPTIHSDLNKFSSKRPE